MTVWQILNTVLAFVVLWYLVSWANRIMRASEPDTQSTLNLTGDMPLPKPRDDYERIELTMKPDGPPNLLYHEGILGIRQVTLEEDDEESMVKLTDLPRTNISAMDVDNVVLVTNDGNRHAYARPTVRGLLLAAINTLSKQPNLAWEVAEIVEELPDYDIDLAYCYRQGQHLDRTIEINIDGRHYTLAVTDGDRKLIREYLDQKAKEQGGTFMPQSPEDVFKKPPEKRE